MEPVGDSAINVSGNTPCSAPEFKADASSTIGMTLSDASVLSQSCYGRSFDRESRQETVRGGTNEQCRY